MARSVLAIFFHNVLKDRLPSDRYHAKQITQGELECTLGFIKKRFTPISLDIFGDIFLGRNKHDFRRPPVMIGFDDGHLGTFTHGGPVLQELKIPAAVFTLARPVIAPRFVPPYVEWFYLVGKAVNHKCSFRGCRYDLDNPKDYSILDGLWRNCKADKYDSFFADLAGAFGISRPDGETLPDDLAYISADGLKNYPGMEYLSVASHGMTHLALDTLNESQQKRELQESHEILKNLAPTYRQVISYPFGRHNATTRRLASGIYDFGFAVEAGASYEDRFAYPRLCIVGGSMENIRYTFSLRRRLVILPLKIVALKMGLMKGPA